MIKKEYTIQEWQAREDYYMDALGKLTIPEMPTSREILSLTSKLDKLYTEASFEFALLKRKESRINLDLKNSEAEMFNILKTQQLTAGVKVTENDIKGLVKSHLAQNALPGYTNDIYTMLKAVMERLVFAEQVVKIIAEKKAGIISATAMLKIENSFTGAKERDDQSA